MRKSKSIISLTLCLMMLIATLTACSANQQSESVQSVSQEQPIVQETFQEVPKEYVSPIDFDALKAENEEIYAWIKIPDTNVDYPILQSMVSDEYYLRTNLKGEYALEGELFTQVTFNYNPFEDAHTVIYGHNMTGYGDTMFSAVRQYDDQAFFDAHREVVIYMPDKELHYTVFAAYRWTDEHLLQTYNWRSQEVFANYINMVLNNNDLRAIIATDVSVTPEDKIITLSTCESNDSEERFLVAAVLQN